MSNVTNFNFENQPITVVEEDGEVWFVASELSTALGYSQTGAMNKIIEDEDRKKRTILNGLNYVNQSLINESGVYQAIFGSTKPEAKRFKKWVTGTVLPEIRKNGLFGNMLFKNNDLVYQEGQDVWTSSLGVSEIFGKEHNNVVRDFSNAVEEIKELEVEVGSKLSASFKMIEFLYIDSMNKPQKAVKVNRPLFNYVVLNYTDKNSNLYRIQFIEKFEELDLQVKMMLSKQAIYSKQNKQHIYVIKNENTGLVKVGISDNPEKRMRTLSNQSGCKLSLIYNSPKCANAFAIEQSIHKMYKDNREFGEWFNASESELVDALKDQEYDFGGGPILVE